MTEVSFKDIAEALPEDKEVAIRLLAEGDVPLEISFIWFPPVVFDTFVAPRARFELSLGFPFGWKYQRAEEIFCAAIESVSPHWGELNQLEVTKFPTLCTLSGHHYCVPHLGTTNYFGPEYCEFFGGVERIMSAGFQRALPLKNGILVSLGLNLNEEGYRRIRGEVEARLAPLETFDSDASVKMPRFMS